MWRVRPLVTNGESAFKTGYAGTNAGFADRQAEGRHARRDLAVTGQGARRAAALAFKPGHLRGAAHRAVQVPWAALAAWRSDCCLVQHRVGNLAEPGDIGADDVVPWAPVLLGR